MSKLLTWIDDRFPLTALWNSQWGKYVAPKNFNFWYYFGSLAAFVLVLQIVTGIWLTMNYKPDATKAFESVEYIMRDVQWGWLIRYMHSTGASMFFVVVYLHMFRGLMYGSYRKPRELTWIIGCLIYLALMAEAFFGYLLPWGQMSYWGAQVIVNLFSTIPVIGEDLALWIRGDYTISDITLNRFFAFHVVALPLVLIGLGTGFSFVPISIIALAGVPDRWEGLASGLMNTTQQVGGAVGVAVASCSTYWMPKLADPCTTMLSCMFSCASALAASAFVTRTVRSLRFISAPYRRKNLPRIAGALLPCTK